MQTGNLHAVRPPGENDKAIIFVHGFSGDQDDTWDRFPGFIGTAIGDWDIYTLGYATTFLPDVVGVWSADPDLPIIATMFRTQLGIKPLDRYKSFAFVAHSMGGLVVQRALIDDPGICTRVRHLVLFGTPSGGLKKAGWVRFWKRQLKNMARDSEFIRDLRNRWATLFPNGSSFGFMVVAGSNDQFVPPESSLQPFDRRYHRVVPGDHLAIAKPKGADSPSVQLLASMLSAQQAAPPETADPLRLAAEEPAPRIAETVAKKGDSLTESEVVDAALALERAGERVESVHLLERYQSLGTDVQGTLAGRIKRMWLENREEALAQRALELYQHALDQALDRPHHEQIYYHAINVAFLSLVAFDDAGRARQMAALALQHCEQAPENVRNVATRAEAHLYLGDRTTSLDLYRQVTAHEAQPWEFASTSLQAGQIASKLEAWDFAEQLEEIFTPGARRTNKIFLSYSHKDREWMERLRTMMQPYLREAEEELELWDDQKIDAGEDWFVQLKNALSTAGVVVPLVSKDFLASDFIVNHELPVILEAAQSGELRLLWVYLSPAAYEATPLKAIQAAHDLRRPLSAMQSHEQDQVLLEVAQTLKAAALSATERYKMQRGALRCCAASPEAGSGQSYDNYGKPRA